MRFAHQPNDTIPEAILHVPETAPGESSGPARGVGDDRPRRLRQVDCRRNYDDCRLCALPQWATPGRRTYGGTPCRTDLLRGGGFVWLGMFDPEPAELREVQEYFGLHEPRSRTRRASTYGLRSRRFDDPGILLRCFAPLAMSIPRGSGIWRGIGVNIAAFRNHRTPRGRQRAAPRPLAAGATPRTAQGRCGGRLLGNPRQARR